MTYASIFTTHFWVAGGIRVSAFAGEGRKVLMVAVSAFPPGKTVTQVAAVQVQVNDLLKIGTKEAVSPLKPFFVPLDEGLKMILHATIIVGCLRMTKPSIGCCARRTDEL